MWYLWFNQQYKIRTTLISEHCKYINWNIYDNRMYEYYIKHTKHIYV